MREKIYINNIPVYRSKENDNTIRYELFEANSHSNDVIHMIPQDTIEGELMIVLKHIIKICKPLENRIRFNPKID